MRRLAKWTTITLLVSTTLLGSAVLYGKAQAANYRYSTENFELCEASLCFMDIKVGATTITELKQKFAEFGGKTQYGYFSATANNVYIEMTASAENPTIAPVPLLTLESRQGKLFSFAYVLERFGAPCYVLQMPDNFLFLKYPFFSLRVLFNQGRMRINSVVDFMQIYDPSGPYAEPTACGGNPQHAIMPWLGFTSIEHYEQYLANKYGEYTK
jgi:hypothetical protein